MALTTAELNVLAGDFVAQVAHMSLHSALPNSSGSNETSATRVVPSLSASGGVVTLSSAAAFTGGASGGAVQYVGFWDGSGTPVFLGSLQITTGDTTFNASGAYTVDNITLTFS